jgi:hypothetical protein
MHTLALTAPETICDYDIAAPEMRADEILLRNLACGVCGGDIKNFKAERSQELTAHGPHPLGGHEFVGEVIAVGADVAGFAIGDRVAHASTVVSVMPISVSISGVRAAAASPNKPRSMQVHLGAEFSECPMKSPRQRQHYANHSPVPLARFSRPCRSRANALL